MACTRGFYLTSQMKYEKLLKQDGKLIREEMSRVYIWLSPGEEEGAKPISAPSTRRR